MTITAEQIPDEVVASYKQHLENNVETTYHAAIAAALNAWPEGSLHHPVEKWEPRKSFLLPALILPLPQKEPRT